MTSIRRLALVAALVAAPASLGAQNSLRFGLAAGPYRVDNLAGTPIVPTLMLLKPAGQRGIFGGNLGLIKSAGFYGLNALTLDLHAGLRSQPATLEWLGTVGPTFIAGGDGDGTPYTSVGGQATTGVTWWAGKHIGVVALATGRVWFTTGNSTFSPGGSIGIVLRR